MRVDSQGRRSPVLATARAQRGGETREQNARLLLKEVMSDRTPRKRTWPSFALAEDGQGKVRAEGNGGGRSERKALGSAGFRRS